MEEESRAMKREKKRREEELGKCVGLPAGQILGAATTKGSVV